MGTFIHFCEHCKAKLNVDNGWLGKSMVCPACGKKITFPVAGDKDEFPSAPDFTKVTGASVKNDTEIPEPPAPPAGNAGKISPPPRKSDGAKLEFANLHGGDNGNAAIGNKVPAAGQGTSLTGIKKPQSKRFTSLDRTSENKTAGEQAEEQEKRASSPFLSSNNVQPPKPFAGKSPEVIKPVRPEMVKSRYLFGRIGSIAVYVLAVAALIVGAYYSWEAYQDYCLAEDMIPEKQQLATVNKDLGDYEKNLSSHFKNAVALLRGSGRISPEGVLDGLLLPEKICRQPAPMPYSILSSSELKAAGKILDQYKESNKKFKEEFVRCFGKMALQDQKEKKSVLHGITRIILQAGEVKKQFYVNEYSKRSQLEALERTVDRAKQVLARTGTPAEKAELKRLEAVNAFVRKQLFPSDDNTTVVKAGGHQTAAPEVKTGFTFNAAGMIASLAAGWQLDFEIARMDNLLKKIPVLVETYEKKKNLCMRKFSRELVTLWIKTLLAVLALLVLGDILRAFFDKADILHRLEGKIHD